MKKKWQLVNAESDDGIFKFKCPICDTIFESETKEEHWLSNTCPCCRSDMTYKREVYNDPPVTLRTFLNIVGDKLIQPYICEVFIVEPDPLFEEVDKQVKFNGTEYFTKKNELEPYMDYEIIKFSENWRWGSLDSQTMWLREVW